MRTIVASIATDWVRKQCRSPAREVSLSAAAESGEVPCDSQDPDTTPSTSAAESEQSVILRTALDELPATERTVVLSRAEDRVQYHWIGPLISRTPESARNLWRRAIARLRVLARSARRLRTGG
jgi:RNA polymerase sigma factor (sigma-70 family)